MLEISKKAIKYQDTTWAIRR